MTLTNETNGTIEKCYTNGCYAVALPAPVRSREHEGRMITAISIALGVVIGLVLVILLAKTIGPW